MFSNVIETTSKRERTRSRIRKVALRSFRERGYDATTIRRIAEEAGVSVGTTNYHFSSKNQLVQELYLEVQSAHRTAATPLLSGESDLIDRLAIVYGTGLDQLAPYHRFAHEFLAAAVSPRSPINPLSSESAESLAIVESLFDDAVRGATRSVLTAEFRDALPPVLTLAHLLLALFWVYDTSPDQTRTRTLLAGGLKCLRLALPLSRVPGLRAPLRELVTLVAKVRS
jgi:AcrR family transcriptional regulator